MEPLKLVLALVIALVLVGVILVVSCGFLYGFIILVTLLGEWSFLALYLVCFIALVTGLVYKEME